MPPLFRSAIALLALLAATWALADPPARVGRLSVAENGVNLRLDRDDEGWPASVNWPISSGAMLDTERRGRAEIWVGSTAFRLSGNSQLSFPIIDDRRVDARIEAGSLAVSILERDQIGEISVETPEGRVSFATPGRYRIDVFSEHTELTTQAGRAHFTDGQRSITVGAGQKARFDGAGRMQVDNDASHDAFDNWVAERENQALTRQSQRYVSPAMTGYQDLDQYGDWQPQSEYGAVWYPRAVASDWAPYRFGRWAWVAPWGWTWIDQSPWGFAPFHYGRWVSIRGRWGWVPGNYVARPVYAPALVAWVGNPGWNARFRFGSAPAVGWFPLAPREVYVPAFRASPGYVRQINITHVNNVTLIDRAVSGRDTPHYTNRALPQAVTVVPTSHLRDGRPITAGELGRHDRHELDRAPQARPAPDKAWLPPANLRPPREERREPPVMRNRDVEERATFRAPSARPPALNETPRRMPESAAPPANGPETERHRDNFRREMPPAPAPGTLPRNEAPPPRVNEPVHIENRPAPMQPVAPQPPAIGERPWDRREERRQNNIRENNLPPAAHDLQREERQRQEMMQRREREISRPMEQARPREIPTAAPAANMPPVQRAMPPAQAMPMPAPMREMPRAEPRGPEPQHGGNHENREQQRPPRGDERGPR